MKNSTLTIKVATAAAGLATFGASFIGAALAAAPDAQDQIGSDAISNQSTPALPDALPKVPENGLAALEQPQINGVSFKMDDGPGRNDDRDNVCHGLNGDHELPGNNNQVQVPCQSDNNSIGEGVVGIAGHEF